MRPFKKKQPFLKNISLRLALAVLLTAALTLTGCSGGGKTSPQETSKQPSSSRVRVRKTKLLQRWFCRHPVTFIDVARASLFWQNQTAIFFCLTAETGKLLPWLSPI